MKHRYRNKLTSDLRAVLTSTKILIASQTSILMLQQQNKVQLHRIWYLHEEHKGRLKNPVIGLHVLEVFQGHF